MLKFALIPPHCPRPQMRRPEPVPYTMTTVMMTTESSYYSTEEVKIWSYTQYKTSISLGGASSCSSQSPSFSACVEDKFRKAMTLTSITNRWAGNRGAASSRGGGGSGGSGGSRDTWSGRSSWCSWCSYSGTGVSVATSLPLPFPRLL